MHFLVYSVLLRSYSLFPPHFSPNYISYKSTISTGFWGTGFDKLQSHLTRELGIILTVEYLGVNLIENQLFLDQDPSNFHDHYVSFP